jgi:asparagine synthase (glutamine-hydrolysing)
MTGANRANTTFAVTANNWKQCVSSHLMSDVPLGVFLSGGLDSSAVAALTTKIRKEPIETFSVGYGEEAV